MHNEQSVMQTSIPFRIGLGMVTTVFVAFVATGEPAWRLVGLMLLWVALFLPTFVYPSVLRRLTTQHPRHLAALIVLIQATAIGLSGGMNSPLILSTVPTSFIIGISATRRQALIILPFPILVILAYFAIAWMGPPTGFVPSMFAVDWPRFLLVGWTALLITSTTAGFVVGGQIATALRTQTQLVLEAQKATIDSLESRQRDMEVFSATVAHELKGPLTVVQGIATTLARHNDHSQRVSEGVAVIVDESHRLRDIVQDLLDVFRPVEREQFLAISVDELCQEVLRHQQSFASERGVELQLQVMRPVYVAADRRKLYAVVLAVIQNAIEASSPDNRVIVHVGWTEAHVIAVEDSGPGISPDIAERLFFPGTSTKETGNGLGLYTSRFLLAQHGGTLTLTNQAGGGCLALICMPEAL